MDLWTIKEAAWLLAGVDPDSAEWIPEEPFGREALIWVRYYQAREALQRADLAEKITTTQCGNYLVTKSVIRWACDGKKWPAFPFTPDDLRMQEGARGPSARWPWGDYSTPQLELLKIAAIEWFFDCDPGSPETVPTKEELVPWLRDQGKCSGSQAAAIFQLLKPPGVRSGPRKAKRK